MVGVTIPCTSPQQPQFGTKLGCQPCRFALVSIEDPKGKFEPQALLCTDLTATPVQILQWFRSRWLLEVTFEETRAHLGFESRASMVIAGDRPHHPCATCAVLNRDCRCSSAASSASVEATKSSLVSEDATDIC